MLTKKVLYGKEAREKLIAGIDKHANAVKITLGAKGRNVIIAKNYRMPYATKDGVSISKEIFLEDEFENVGSMILKEAAQKSADQAGDGTTTATVLAQYIIHEGISKIDSGANPAEIKVCMEKAVKSVVEQIAQQAVKITTSEQILQVATIAANNDSAIGEIVAEAIGKIGNDGIVSIGETLGLHTTVKVVEGMKIDKGYISPHFITHPNKMICELENPYILISEKKITIVKDIMPVLELCAKSGRPLLILADDFEGEALATMVVNKMQGKIKCCAVKLPSFGDARKEFIADIVSITGATVISPERGKLILPDVRHEHLGTAQKITVDKDSTIIVGNDDRKDAVSNRVLEMKEQLASTDEIDMQNFITARIAKLTGGIAVIHVGGSTDIEIREKKDRVDDAIRATQSALQEGIVAGGGIALLKCNCDCPIIQSSLSQPFNQIISNAGLDSTEIAKPILISKKPTFGYNALTNEYGDMLEMGIIDSAKVVRCALENASSVAIGILMSDCVMVEEKMKENGQ